MRVWIDIDNPPQVQYLWPFEAVFREAGADVVVTARDYGNAFELLEAQGAVFHRIGERFGKRKWEKAAGLVRRGRALTSFLRGRERPDALLCSGRVSAVAARRLGIPSFVLTDYEYVHVAIYGLTGSHLLHPEVIDPAVFERRGIDRGRLIPFRGLKEDVSFRGVDLSAVPPHVFPELDGASLTRLLYRPPAEESHYYRSASGGLSLELLGYLAGRADAVVVFAPRYPYQEEHLRRFAWANPPIVLREAVPFVSLLTSVDLVVSSGGTMAREAAYLGLPAYSIFQGKTGAVDRHLASLGRLRFVSSPSEFPAIRLERRQREGPLATNPRLAEDIADTVLARVFSRG